MSWGILISSEVLVTGGSSPASDRLVDQTQEPTLSGAQEDRCGPAADNLNRGTTIMKIELLYFKGCPTYKLALDRLRAVLRETNADAQIEMVEVNSVEEAQKLRFLGSPSLRVNGLDVESEARERTGYGLTCRMYETESGLEGSPPLEAIRKAVSDAMSREREP